MRQKHKKIICMFAAALWLAFSFLFVEIGSVYRPEHVDQAAYRPGFLYGVDIQDQNYMIFEVDLNTGETRRIRVPRMEGTTAVSLSDLTPVVSGDVYILRTETNGDKRTDAIWRCDFGRGRLAPGFELADDERLSFRTMIKYGQTLQVLYQDENQDLLRYVLENGVLSFDKRLPCYGGNTALRVIVEDGSCFVIDQDGRLYQLTDEDTYRCVLETTRNGADSWKTNFQFYQSELYFDDSKTGATYRVDLTSDILQLEPCESTYRRASSFEEGRLSSDYIERTVRYGIYAAEDGRQLAAVCGDYEYVAEEISFNQREKLAAAAAVWGLGCLIGFSGMLLWRYLVRRQRVIPLVLEAVVLTTGLMVPGIWFLKNQMLLILRESALENDIRTGVQLGQEYMDILDMEAIRAMCSYSAITEENQRSLVKTEVLSQKPGFFDGDTGETRTQADMGSAAYRLYFKKDGQWYPLGIRQYISNLPLRYSYSKASPLAMEAMERTLAGGGIVTLEYVDLEGQQCSAFFLVPDSGEYPVLLETAIPLDETNRTYVRQAAQLEKLIYLLSAVLLVSLWLLIWFAMGSVGRLKQAALKVMNGQLGTQVRIRGRSEAAVTAVRFNHMSKQLEKQVSGIRRFQEKYEAFIPLRFLEENGGDWYVTMIVGTGACPECSENMIREIRGGRGEVLSFENGALSCLFAGKAQDCLKAAVNILQQVRSGGKETGISIGYERVFLGVIGNEARSAVSSHSTLGDFSDFLRKKAEEYRTPLLITQTAANGIPGFFSEYHVRRLGVCFLRAAGMEETIYEVLDGEDWERQRKKQMTGETFLRGLDAFEAGEYLNARTEFIRVFSVNKEDGAALRYIRLCDNNLAEEGSIQTYIDIY